MAEPKTRPTSASVADFLAPLPADRRADCQRISELMQAATGQPPQMWGTAIVGFGAYAVPCGKQTNEWPVIAFSPRKTELVLYLMPGYEAEADALARLGKHKIGKSCLYLKKLADVDEAVLRGLIDRAVAGMAAKRLR
jgi:Domain of unknown function (DU1801)